MKPRRYPRPAFRSVATLLVAPLLLMLFQVLAGPTGCRSTSTSESSRSAVSGRPFFARGLALTEIHPGHGEVVYSVALDRIRAIGADWVLLPVYGYMDSAAAPGVDSLWEPPVSLGEYRAFVGQLVREAHQRDLSVLIIPYLNIRSGPASDWRGNIRPPDRQVWFDSYREFLDGWVTLARTEKVEMLAVGAELVSTEDSTEAWQVLIRDVRRRYPGRIIYSFNWDHYSEAAFHRDLDLVGISGYYSLPPDVPLSPASLEQNWRRVRALLVAFGHKVERPILFTEVGYASVEGSARDPWDYLRKGPVDTAGQARAISAFIRVWRGTPELAGVFFWNLSPVRGGPLDPSYSIQGKPAEAEIRLWYQDSRLPSGAP